MKRKSKMIAFAVAFFVTCFTLIAIPMSGCTTVQGFTRMEEMEDAEYERFAERAATQVAAIAQVAVNEGDLSRETVGVVAENLRLIANGSVVGVGVPLMEALDLDGYGALALTFAMTELEARLDQSGAYSDEGLLSPRGVGVLLAVAGKLDKMAN